MFKTLYSVLNTCHFFKSFKITTCFGLNWPSSSVNSCFLRRLLLFYSVMLVRPFVFRVCLFLVSLPACDCLLSPMCSLCSVSYLISSSRYVNCSASCWFIFFFTYSLALIVVTYSYKMSVNFQWATQNHRQMLRHNFQFNRV
jgi:hypothetical protein